MRMLDANVNRAREGLRVMEDAARFGLDDAALCGELKAIRHDLRAALDAAGVVYSDLMAARDTPGDVGTTIATEAEGRREGMRGIAAAAGSRSGEALRVIEECLKARGARAEAARAVEAIRYRAYETARRLDLALGGGRAPQWALCVLITESLCRRGWEHVAHAAIAGGADCLQLREKALDGRELLRRARRLAEIARAGARRVHVIINDRPDIARMAGADGTHLGQHDVPAAEARRVVGAGLLIGVSTSNLDEARTAVRDGADYCGVGPMFATTTKDKPRLAGPEYLRAYLSDPIASRIPHLPIGGISAANAGVLRAAGARGLAVSSAVCGADDPETVCRRLAAG